MSDLLILPIILVVWIFVQAWLLPRLGISTWVKQACPVEDKEEKSMEKGNQQGG